MRSIIVLLSVALCLLASGARATEADNYCASGTTSTGAIIWLPCGSSGSGSITIIPGPLVYVGKQLFSAATLATSTALTPPTGATIANFFPECSAAGTDNQCVRFDPGATADASADAGIASQQLYLGETSTLANIRVILAAGASGASGTIPTLAVYYYRAGP